MLSSLLLKVLSDLCDLNNLKLDYPELLQKCGDFKIMSSDEGNKIVEANKQRSQDSLDVEQEELEPL